MYILQKNDTKIANVDNCTYVWYHAKDQILRKNLSEKEWLLI